MPPRKRVVTSNAKKDEKVTDVSTRKKTKKDDKDPNEKKRRAPRVKERTRAKWSYLDWWDVVLLFVIQVHVFLTPFTKVEESFNMQGIHDLLFHKQNIDQYDHHEFPGVVPRTFLGAIVVSLVSFVPFVALNALASVSPLMNQILVRSVLGFLVWISLTFFGKSLKIGVPRFARRKVEMFFALICAAQFHLPFYASRTLPNTFALALVLIAMAYWIRGKIIPALVWLAVASTVFRCDVAVFAFPLCIWSLLMIRTRKGAFRFLGAGLAASGASIGLSTAVDSMFWKRLLWPEGSVLWYNTVLNKSSDWGVMPFHWYFTSALPRALNFTAILVPIGVVVLFWKSHRLKQFDKDFARFIPMRVLVVSTLVYVVMYSLLPHKELRFIFPSIVVFNAVAAISLGFLFEKSRKNLPVLFLLLSGVCVVLMTLQASIVFTYIAMNNYPGGVAFDAVHQFPQVAKGKTWIHSEVEACQTGVTRFGEHGGPYRYSKEENLKDLTKFHYVLTSNRLLPFDYRNNPVATFEELACVDGFDRIELLQFKENVSFVLEEIPEPFRTRMEPLRPVLENFRFMIPKVRMEPKICVFRRVPFHKL